MNTNNMLLATVLGIFISVFLSIAKGSESLNDLPGPIGGGFRQGRLFFPLPNLPSLPGFGNGGGLADLINCRPFNRTFVQHRVLCNQPNATVINCRNQTCVCNSISLGSGMPGAGQLPSFPSPIPNFPSLPNLPVGGMPTVSVWNCTVSSTNGTTPNPPQNPPSNSTGATGSSPTNP